MFGLPVNLTFRWANLGKKGKHVSLIFLGLHCVGPNFEQLTMMVKLLLLSSRLRRYCQIFIEYISAIDDKDLWYGYFCRNLIEWRTTECDNWANEQKTKWQFSYLEKNIWEDWTKITDWGGCIAQPVDQQKSWSHLIRAGCTADHPDRTEADATSGFYIDRGLSLGWTGHYCNRNENKLLFCVIRPATRAAWERLT